MTKIQFVGAVSELDMENFVVLWKAKNVKKCGYGSPYSEQTSALRDVLHERSATFNRVWRQGW